MTLPAALTKTHIAQVATLAVNKAVALLLTTVEIKMAICAQDHQVKRSQHQRLQQQHQV
jgi:hypothetical protein